MNLRLASALLSAGLACAGAHGQPVSPEADPCPGASAWRAAHPEQSAEAIAERDRLRKPSNRELLGELLARTTADQQARQRLLANPQDRAARQAVASVDQQNLHWLKAEVRSNGIPTAEAVGEHGLQLIWLLVQHADAEPQWQAQALGEFEKRYRSGEFPGELLAKLTDRVLIANGKPQRYGTQFDWYSGRFEPTGTLRVDEINASRAKLGLMPLSDYACFMNSVLKRTQGPTPR